MDKYYLPNFTGDIYGQTGPKLSTPLPNVFLIREHLINFLFEEKIKRLNLCCLKMGKKEGRAAIYKIQGKHIEVKNTLADLLLETKKHVLGCYFFLVLFKQ